MSRGWKYILFTVLLAIPLSGVLSAIIAPKDPRQFGGLFMDIVLMLSVVPYSIGVFIDYKKGIEVKKPSVVINYFSYFGVPGCYCKLNEDALV